MRPGKVSSIMSRFPVSVLVILAESSLGAGVEEVSVISDIMCKTLPYHLFSLYVSYTVRGTGGPNEEPLHGKCFCHN